MSASEARERGDAKADPSSGATSEYSKQKAVRWALYGAGLVGALLLLLTVFLPIVSIRVITVVKEEQVGFDRHGPAMLILALFALVLLYFIVRLGRVRSARLPMLALGAIGLVAALLALVVDLPDLNSVGTYGQNYDQATAEVGIGFYLETLGAVLLIAAGGGLLFTSQALPDEPATAD